MTYILFDQE